MDSSRPKPVRQFLLEEHVETKVAVYMRKVWPAENVRLHQPQVCACVCVVSWAWISSFQRLGSSNHTFQNRSGEKMNKNAKNIMLNMKILVLYMSVIKKGTMESQSIEPNQCTCCICNNQFLQCLMQREINAAILLFI